MMQGRYNSLKLILALLLAGTVVLSGCAGGNTAKAVINGQEIDLNVEAVEVIAGGLGGSVLPGQIGFPTSGNALEILMVLSSAGALSDFIQINLPSIQAVQLGQQVPINGSQANAIVQLNGQYPIVFGGVIVFDSLSNVQGRNVSGSFRLDLGGGMFGVIFGDFSADVRVGF